MKTYLLILVTTIIFTHKMLAQEAPKKALLLIDIQEFYFPDGFSALHEPEEAAANAALMLEHFRQTGDLVIHVQHQVEKQMDIYPLVRPKGGEKVFVKSEVSCFNGSNLQVYLQERGIQELVVVGMQTHMCVEAAIRAGYDLGYTMTLISDACATKDLMWGEEVVNWKDVQLATLSTLKNYATILTRSDYINANRK